MIKRARLIGIAAVAAAVVLSLVGCRNPAGNADPELTGIAVTTPPTKTVYEIGEAFDPAGMVVTATYDDGSTAVVPHADLEIGTLDSASAGERTVTVTYRGMTANVIVTVTAPTEPPPAPESVTVTPAAVDVDEGQTHQFTSSVLPQGAPQAVAWTVEPEAAGTITTAGFLTLTGATAGDTVTVRATASGTEVSGTATVTVTAPTEPPPAPASVTVTPAAVDVDEGQTHQFASEVLPQGAPQAVAWTVEPATAGTITEAGFLTLTGATGGDTVTVRATASGTAVSGTATVTVTAPPPTRTGIEVTSGPDRTRYWIGDGFDPAGMTVVVHYSDGSDAPVTGFTWNPTVFNTAGTIEVTISYDGFDDTLYVTVSALGMTSSGDSHTAAIRADGSLWTWGTNTDGRLGDGSTTDRNSPVRIGGTSTDWTYVSAGGNHTVALRRDGSLWAWGSNQFGQIGDGTTDNRLVPTRIGELNDWVFVSAGGTHTMAIREDTTLWAWGQNAHARLGIGGIVDQHSPSQAATATALVQATGWTFVSAGFSHTMAINDGALFGWGQNANGQLGNGLTTTGPAATEPAPIANVSGSPEGWVSVSAGLNYTMAIGNDGSLWGWGQDNQNQQGQGAGAAARPNPLRVGSDNDWASVAASFNNHTMAVRTDGTLWGWGQNANGRIGDGTMYTRPSPVRVGSDNDWAMVSAGNGFTTAMRENGSIFAWGLGRSGQLGNGFTFVPDIFAPVEAGNGFTWTQKSMGNAHMVAIRSDGSLWAWGNNAEGRLGDDTTVNRSFPVRIDAPSTNWRFVSAGNNFTTAIRNDGSLWTWGNNTDHRLGIGAVPGSTPPVALPHQHTPVRVGSDNDWHFVSAGDAHVLAIRTDGSLWAWGSNANGRIGDGTRHLVATPNHRPEPIRIGTENDWVFVSAGASHSAGIREAAIGETRSLWIWGNPANGRLGWTGTGPGFNATAGLNFGLPLDTNEDTWSPRRIGDDTDWATVAAGNNHTMAVRYDGALFGWGQNGSGQLGDGTNQNPRNDPIRIGSDNNWESVSGGMNHTMAIRTDGTLWGWGNNLNGKLGDGTTTHTMAPGRIGTETNWTSVIARNENTSGMRTGGVLSVWGTDTAGQLGAGLVGISMVPIPVTLP